MGLALCPRATNIKRILNHKDLWRENSLRVGAQRIRTPVSRHHQIFVVSPFDVRTSDQQFAAPFLTYTFTTLRQEVARRESLAREAFRLLTVALRRGYGLDLVGRDTDLDPIRNRPEFRRLVDAARALQPQSASR